MSDGMTINQMGSTAADAVVFNTIYHRLFNLRVIGKAQIVIAAKADDFFIINGHFNLLRAFGYTAASIPVLLFSFIKGLFKALVKVFQKSEGALISDYPQAHVDLPDSAGILLCFVLMPNLSNNCLS